MTAEAIKLPSKPSSAEAPKRDVFKALSDVQDTLLYTPDVEFKRFTVLAGDYPLYVTTRINKVRSVTAGGAWLADSDPATAAYAGSVHWQAKGNADGDLKINGFQSLSSGTKYIVELRIEGER